MNVIKTIFACFLLTLVFGCKEDISWNNPYPNDLPDGNIFYTSFSERPKHLDPSRSYSSNEWSIITQIYEPPYQYNYFKRPYKLESLVGEVSVKDLKDGFTVWEVKIKPGIYYQPHPAFVKNENGKHKYLSLTRDETLKYKNILDFKDNSTRELTAYDYVYQIKRLADPKLNSPIYGFLSDYIFGLKDLRHKLLDFRKKNKHTALDLRKYDFPGAYVVDKYTYRILINGKYPQFKYWLAMPFFAPIPWEADLFFQQSGMEEHNLSLDWYPVGTGPYMLVENNPERKIVMVKNPNFHGENLLLDNQNHFKDNKNSNDENLNHSQISSLGEQVPFIDKIVFTLEKEDIPYWNKFLQGYYDISGISSDTFASAIDTTPRGSLDLTEELKNKGITLLSTYSPSTMYWGFNMLDEIIGGYDEKNIKLRQAISIAFDVEEFINIFLNGRGIVAHDPIPPGIVGHKIVNNKYIYDESIENGDLNKKSLAYAKQLLKEAGYPDGRHSITGEPLTINFEAISSGDPNEKAIFSWLSKQFDKLGIQLNIRVTDYNRFRDKMNNGTAQMFFWGWNADYPDPENFLFMFYSQNSKVKHGGENASNYHNPEFDGLFEELKLEIDDNKKEYLIKKMINILQKDSPWIWGYHPQSFILQHEWVKNNFPHSFARNTIKYLKIDAKSRELKRLEWNKPLYWPFFIILLVTSITLLPAIIVYWKKERFIAKKIKS